MSHLPTGTVTFLFTDIEGSTKLWQQFPDAMPYALARHHELLTQCIERHDGYVFQIIGDAFCAAFATAADGLDAALDAQRALLQEAWGETGAIRVRMSLHTGAVEVRPGEFKSGEYASGYTLSRAARLLSAGHGGQILLSAPTMELVREHLPSGVSLRELGAHRLKDLVLPQQIFQTLTPDLPQDFPALKTLDVLSHNLPIQPTSFIGREQELKDIRRLLGKTHLLTLIGAGGSGKTRLALQFAADAIDEFDKGAWFVELAPITDPALVPVAALNALDLREVAGREPLDVLSDYLGTKIIFLVLDNCEHLVEACAQLAAHLLTHCPNVQILATSREALGIPGEVLYRVPTLALPDPKHLPALASLSQYDAVRLFIERAAAVQPDFSITNANAPAVAQICYRLDGIPLALELAAARIKLFSPEQIAARLDDRFRLLTSGSRTAVPRQQTLRAAIDWSYSLLSEPERILFRRLAVFAGGWTFEAAETVCEGNGIDALDILEALAHLVDKSLVTTERRAQETRYHMLETIREYALEKLNQANETDALRARHLEFFVAFSEQVEPELTRADQFVWLERLGDDADNLRAALDYSLGAGHVDNGLRLAGALMRYWDLGANWREGLEILEKLLRHPKATAKSVIRAKALLSGGIMAENLGAVRARQEYFEECMEIARAYHESGGKPILAEALGWYGDAAFKSKPDVWEAMINEGYEIACSLNNEWLIGWLTFLRGHISRAKNDLKGARELYQASSDHFKAEGDGFWADVALFQASRIFYKEGDYARARREIEASLEFSRKLKQRDMITIKLTSLGDVARLEQRYDLAREYCTEAIEIARETGAKWALCLLCNSLGYVELHDGDAAAARPLALEAFQLARDLANEPNMVFCLLQSASVAAVEKQAQKAVYFFAFGDRYFQEHENGFLDPLDKMEFERYLAIARSHLSEQDFNTAWEQGRAATVEQALALAVAQVNPL